MLKNLSRALFAVRMKMVNVTIKSTTAKLNKTLNNVKLEASLHKKVATKAILYWEFCQRKIFGRNINNFSVYFSILNSINAHFGHMHYTYEIKYR